MEKKKLPLDAEYKKKKKKTSGDGEGADLEMEQLPPDEERCSHTCGQGIYRYRCKNFRMGYGADDDDTLPKTKRCEKHYYYYGKYNKNLRKKKKKVTEEEGDTSNIEGASSNVGTKTKKKKLPPDEQRCSKMNGMGWRCRNFRNDKSKHCEKHYNYVVEYEKKKKKKLLKKKTSGNGDTIVAGGSAKIGAKRKHVERTQGSGELKSLKKTVVVTRTYKRWKNVKEGDHFVAETSNQPANVGTKTNKNKEMEMEKEKLPPDEQRCGITGFGGWRCKNFRMGHGAAADDHSVPKTKYCEKHHNYYAEKKLVKKKSSGNDDTIVAGGSAKIGAKRKHVQGSGELKSSTKTVVETRASKRRKNVTEGDRFVAETSNQPATHDNSDSDTIVEGGSANDGRKRKYAERISGELEPLAGTREAVAESESLKHYKTKCFELSVELEKKKAECTELHGKLVEVETRKTTSTDENEQTLADATDRWKKLLSCLQSKENEKSTRGCGESRESLTGSREPAVELESLEHYKSKCFELSVELEKKEFELVKKKEDLENMSVDLEKKKVECTKLHGKLVEVETRKTTATDETEQTPADATEFWKKLLSDLESLLQSKENENSTMGCVESRISSLESLVLRMKSKKSTTGRFVDSHISKCESLVFRSEKESSILKCVELRNSERVESEVPGLQNDITQNCGNTGKLTDEISRSKLNAEASTGGRKDSHVYECKAKEKVLNVCDVGANKHHDTESEFPKYSAMNISSSTLHLSSEGQNVEEGKDWGCSSKKPSQHGSSSQDPLEMSTEPFSNLVSDDVGESLGKSEDFESSVNSENSLGDPMDMLAMKNWNKNKDEMKWKSEADMLSSFEEDAELCLKAVCALYRQEISEDEISPKGLLFHDDTLRCSTLAKFLMDKDCKGDVKSLPKSWRCSILKGLKTARGWSEDTRFIYLISTKTEKILFSYLLQLPSMENKHLSDSRLLCSGGDHVLRSTGTFRAAFSKHILHNGSNMEELWAVN